MQNFPQVVMASSPDEDTMKILALINQLSGPDAVMPARSWVKRVTDQVTKP